MRPRPDPPGAARCGPPGQDGPPAPDLVNRRFTASGPDRLWLAAVRDVFSNRIVGWKTSCRCDTDPVLGALEYAIWSGDVRDGQLSHHSDRGSTYTSFRLANRLSDNGILPSTGSVGDSNQQRAGWRTSSPP